MQLSKSKSVVWYLYLVKSPTGMLYTGISTEPARRLRQHNGELAGGAKALRGKGPFELAFSLAFADKSSASKAEALVKSWSKERKLQLCQHEPLPLGQLNQLCAESRIEPAQPAG
ncbi:GIY-YIG nuclease family protein [Rheinheimera sp.]|uniref:GIY-YIG nuclease family protein n=1 Tax=Rheinheimera sp. TaxID=1869214 RepID=UPI003AF69502